MRFSRFAAAALAVILANLAAAPAAAFAEEPAAVSEEQTVDIAPVLPDDLDFSKPGMTVRTDVVPGCTGIIFTVPREKYELYQQAYSETGRAGLTIDVAFDDFHLSMWDDAFGTSASFAFFGGDGANGDIMECDCTTDDEFEVWTGTTDSGDVIGMLYGQSDQWVFQRAMDSISCQFRYYIMSAGEVVDGSTESSTFMLRPGEEHKIKDCEFKALPTVTYTGKEFKPDIEATYQGRELNKGYDYTVEYKNNQYPGLAEVKVTGINSYTGTKTLKFKILPPKTELKGRKTGSAKKATLTWSRPAGLYFNYEVQAAEGKGKFTKLTDIQNNKLYVKVKWTADSGCRFRVRPYITVNGKRIYGKWSNVVKLK